MKAVQLTAPGNILYHDVPTPPLTAGHVLIRVKCTSICGTDVEIYDGVMPYFTSGMAHYPVIPGHEWAGEVVEAAPDVTGFAPGDHVVGECSVGCGECPRWCSGEYHRCPNRTETGILNRDGGFAEYIVFPATYLHKIDRSVPFQTACMVEPTAIAFNGVARAEVTPRDYVVVFGDGPIGLLVLQVALAFGARRVVVVGMMQNRLDAAQRMGAHAALMATDNALCEKLLAYGDGSAPDAVIEATGNPGAVQQAINTVRVGGRVSLLGVFAGQPAQIDLDAIVLGDLTVRGALGSPHIWGTVIRLIEEQRVRPEQIITHVLGLDEFTEGLRLVRDRVGIKVVISQEEAH